MFRRTVVASLLVMSFAAGAAAQPPPAPPALHRLSYSNLFAARVNPLGVMDQFALGYRLRLMRSQNPFLIDNFLHTGLSLTASPAFARVGGEVVVQPASVFSVGARYQYYGYFGTLDQIRSYPGPESDFSDSADLKTKNDDPHYSTGGSMLTLTAILQGAFGGFALRNVAAANMYDMDVNAGHTAFYDQLADLLVPAEGWAFTNDLDFFHLFDFGLIVGARYSAALAFHDSDDGPGTETTHRVGPVLAWRFKSDRDAHFEKPTLILLVQWWLAHPYRTGEVTSQALPYIALAFNFEGDLWTSTGK